MLRRLDKMKGLDVGESYLNDKAAVSFVQSIANVTQEDVVSKLHSTKYFSITCDGSTDYTGEELETLYIRVCMKGKTDDTFLSIGSPKSTSSGDIFKMIQGTFPQLKVEQVFDRKRVGFCADGASNMQGMS